MIFYASKYFTNFNAAIFDAIIVTVTVSLPRLLSLQSEKIKQEKRRNGKQKKQMYISTNKLNRIFEKDKKHFWGNNLCFTLTIPIYRFVLLILMISIFSIRLLRYRNRAMRVGICLILNFCRRLSPTFAIQIFIFRFTLDQNKYNAFYFFPLCLMLLCKNGIFDFIF